MYIDPFGERTNRGPGSRVNYIVPPAMNNMINVIRPGNRNSSNPNWQTPAIPSWRTPNTANPNWSVREGRGNSPSQDAIKEIIGKGAGLFKPFDPAIGKPDPWKPVDSKSKLCERYPALCEKPPEECR